MATTADTTTDELRSAWDDLRGAEGPYFDAQARLEAAVENHIRTEHPLVWETFEPHDAEYLIRHGGVGRDPDGLWYVVCDEPCDEGMFCAHAGPFESEAAAWERLDALGATPYAALVAWQEVAG